MEPYVESIDMFSVSFASFVTLMLRPKLEKNLSNLRKSYGIHHKSEEFDKKALIDLKKSMRNIQNP